MRDYADRGAAVYQGDGRQRVSLMVKDDGQIRHQIESARARVSIAVGKLLATAHELVLSSSRSWASCAAAPEEY